MLGAVHLLPGTTQSSIAAKGDYDAEGMATMTLSEFHRWFTLEICRYNNSIHSSLGCTRGAKWEALSEEMMGDIPFEMEAFRVSFLPSELRKVRRDGIHLFQIRYWSDALAGHIGRGDGKVVVRYDPCDISMIWVELDDGRYVGHPQFVWRHYPETEKFRRDSHDFEEPLVARERCFGSKR
ncbi:Mu transposase C-terminal domain-containing protein [Celeribacter persicus]|uniref:Mu transposase-like protein n=1 Tax=Celeribacter persicus TaxID=1651082 RepID=A0A2T5H426_9RHOB|nr:Mu transposase C-terminal domain-containing protein [Celeribacter persicus]PTQ66259.1 Mu transposase-like protein [Celeribacter persicus]